MASKMVDLTGDSDSEPDNKGNGDIAVSGEINSIVLPKSVEKPRKHIPSFGIEKVNNVRDVQASQVAAGGDLQQNKLTLNRFTYCYTCSYSLTYLLTHRVLVCQIARVC